jgi:hypothetical protein
MKTETKKTYIILIKNNVTGVILKHSEFKGKIGDLNTIIYLLNDNHINHSYRIEDKSYLKNNYNNNLDDYIF